VTRDGFVGEVERLDRVAQRADHAVGHQLQIAGDFVTPRGARAAGRAARC
jgi:hypothetical protein